MTSLEEEEVWCEVSDDEMYNPGKMKKGTWEPTAEDILKVFEEIKSKKVLDLHWKCPGRRHPDTDVKKEEDNKEEKVTTPVKQEEKKPSIPNEFDFDEDDMGGSKTVITPRRTPGSVPKSQKKEAKMDKILKDMMQQRKLQAAEREARKLAGNKSPRTPASPGRARIGSPAGSPRTPNRQSPVRIGAGQSDQITTTPVRPPSETFSAIQPGKLDSHNVSNSKIHDNGFNNSSSGLKNQVQQSTPSVSAAPSNNIETQSKNSNSGEATPQTSQGADPSQTMQREVTSNPQAPSQIQQVNQPMKTAETKAENTEIKPEASNPPTEKMDTS
ncbi:uncharacterized protein LOC132757945 [Ruditapes philippinarum]|uniref:uncharacterized protein LOC132757945 n=1 Tax=Ruditapes philippinarum TaxID=129788 RepID=UPI00295B43E9|nr:uncharacterized protein LOC132757945 [Ruditapes philippinarum]